jgi:hypothetical protein
LLSPPLQSAVASGLWRNVLTGTNCSLYSFPQLDRELNATGKMQAKTGVESTTYVPVLEYICRTPVFSLRLLRPNSGFCWIYQVGHYFILLTSFQFR